MRVDAPFPGTQRSRGLKGLIGGKGVRYRELISVRSGADGGDEEANAGPEETPKRKMIPCGAGEEEEGET